MISINQFSLVGKVKRNASKDATRSGGIYFAFDLEVIKNFREADFSYKTEVYTIHLWKGLSAEIMKHRKVNDSIAVNGRFEKHGDDILLIAENLEYLA